MTGKERVNGLLSAATFCMLCLLSSCGDQLAEEGDVAGEAKAPIKLFEQLTPERTGIGFVNNIYEDGHNNIFDYDYMYTGSGVAVGDINNDGLLDIYFGGNMETDRLYLNKGGLEFEDITERAGLDKGDGWTMGVLMADLTGDNLTDIYVCRSYYQDDADKRANLLYVNQGNGTFKEDAATHGLDDRGYSVHAALLDYDRDGDLDMYVTNHPVEFDLNTSQRIRAAREPAPAVRDRLYRNDGGTYTDVSDQAGIKNYGYGLGVAVSDVDNDGYTDIYVANDYEEPDLFYHNNGDGTFTEAMRDHFQHISYFGMGSDLADFNNDGHLDLAVMDMAAEDNYRQKTMMASMNIPRFWELVAAGRHYQYMRNTLQVNNGNGSFSEIGQFSGVSKSDWSWAVLLADLDNDGWKDMFISNGYRRDSRNVDAVNELFEFVENRAGKMEREDVDELLKLYPSQKMVNHVLSNNRDNTFSKKSFEWGITLPSFSNGAAYADLDNDGDLDLVVNNLVDPAFVYESKATEANNNSYLRVALNGPEGNPLGIGTKLTLNTKKGMQFQEISLSRGYISCVEPKAHFGIEAGDELVSLTVEWPDGSGQTINNLEADQVFTLNYSDYSGKLAEEQEPPAFFTEVAEHGLSDHVENEFDDFEREILLPYKTSAFGPAMATADVNGDGLDDIFIGGAASHAGRLYIQQTNGRFKLQQAFTADAAHEDVSAIFFDADGKDGLDLYVVSGGNEFAPDHELLQDRLYLANNGSYKRADIALPSMRASGGCVAAGDMDADGNLDLFVGGLLDPGRYPHPGTSFVLKNNGGTFTDVTSEIAPDLSTAGMVKTAVWTDVNGDGQTDLILAGHWMELTCYLNDKGKLSKADVGLANTNGWWNTLTAADIDNDGDMDLLAGNFGENAKFKVSQDEPLHVYGHDFDASGTVDIVLGYYNQGVCYPVRGRQCSSEQMPNIKDKFPTYHDYGSATLEDVYGDGLSKALHYEAKLFASVCLVNDGGQFTVKRLPAEAQYSTVFGIEVADVDGDGASDLMVTGNFHVLEIETGRNDASTGYLMLGTGDGTFKTVPSSGLLANKDGRQSALINTSKGRALVVANNNGPVQVFNINGQKRVALMEKK